MELTINKLKKSFGDLKVIDNLDLNFKLNKVHCIFGPSGCGKSTLFNIIAGVVPADGGEIGEIILCISGGSSFALGNGGRKYFICIRKPL